MSSNYHFRAVRPVEDLVLSAEHKLSGHVAQYLRDFQLEGIRFLYKHFENNESCILNDESGLGKTATVCAFLETVLPHDGTRNCLIIVKNDDRLKNWKFHLEALCKLGNKVVFRDEDVSDEIVFLTKWDSLQKSASLAKRKFDCVIIDNRGELLANKICSGYLLRNYTNNVSLVVSSADVAIDLKQFHMMLKMCGRLDKTFENIQVFEEKFALPSPSEVSGDVNLLETYFLRRERIINFCREFRLRRYRHQYEDAFPLVQPEEYIQSLNMWITTPQINSDYSSSSVKILSSSSEKDAEQLLKSYFGVRQKDEVSDIVKFSKVTHDDDDDMPPLVLESDPEEHPTNQHKKSKPLRKLEYDLMLDSVNTERYDGNSEGLIGTKKGKTTSNEINGKPCTKKRQTRSKRSLNKSSEFLVRRNMRSVHATRSKAQKTKYLLFESRNIYDKKKSKTLKEIPNQAKIELKNAGNKKVQKQDIQIRKPASTIARSRFQKQNTTTETEKSETGEVQKDFKKIYSTRSRVKRISPKIFDYLDKLKKKKTIKKSSVKTKNVLSHDKMQGTKFHNPKNNAAKIADKKVSQILKNKNIDETLKIATNRKKAKTDSSKEKSGIRRFENRKKNSSNTPQDDVIVLSTSTDNCTPLSTTNSVKALQAASGFISSPDIFSNVTDDCEILCSQKDKIHTKLTSSSTTTILRSRNSSCLELLEKEFYTEKPEGLRANRQNLGISISDSFERNFMRINEEISEITPAKSRATTFQKNKITKYLIGSELTNQGNSFQLTRYGDRVDGPNGIEGCPKTPKKPKQRNMNIFSKSPKNRVPKDITPNNLKSWLIKPQLTNKDAKSCKRRRLDLWFND